MFLDCYSSHQSTRRFLVDVFHCDFFCRPFFSVRLQRTFASPREFLDHCAATEKLPVLRAPATTIDMNTFLDQVREGRLRGFVCLERGRTALSTPYGSLFHKVGKLLVDDLDPRQREAVRRRIAAGRPDQRIVTDEDIQRYLNKRPDSNVLSHRLPEVKSTNP